MPGEKTQAVWDYSEHATITQGQLLEKSSKNAIFLKVMWKTPLFKRLPRLARARKIRQGAILRGLQFLAPGRSRPVFLHRSRDHFNCAVGAHTHNIALSCGREKKPGRRRQ
jgi:hypothetical protein